MQEDKWKVCNREAWAMSKPRMYGAFAAYTPNNRADARFNRKGYERAKLIAGRATPRTERRLEKRKTHAVEKGR